MARAKADIDMWYVSVLPVIPGISGIKKRSREMARTKADIDMWYVSVEEKLQTTQSTEWPAFLLKAMEQRIKIYIFCHFDAYTPKQYSCWVVHDNFKCPPLLKYFISCIHTKRNIVKKFIRINICVIWDISDQNPEPFFFKHIFNPLYVTNNKNSSTNGVSKEWPMLMSIEWPTQAKWWHNFLRLKIVNIVLVVVTMP